MSDLSSLLREIPDEFKPLAALGIGALILVGLVLFHGAGLHRILVWRKRTERRLRLGRPHPLGAAVFFASAVFLMLTLHIAEILIWSFLLSHLGLIQRVQDSIYFCANAYTTVGYGQVALDEKWRNISPIIAFCGTIHVCLDNQLSGGPGQGAQPDNRTAGRRTNQRAGYEDVPAERRSLMRLIREREAERQERERARKEATGASFFERRRVWKEEKQRVQQLREDEEG